MTSASRTLVSNRCPLVPRAWPINADATPNFKSSRSGINFEAARKAPSTLVSLPLVLVEEVVFDSPPFQCSAMTFCSSAQTFSCVCASAIRACLSWALLFAIVTRQRSDSQTLKVPGQVLRAFFRIRFGIAPLGGPAPKPPEGRTPNPGAQLQAGIVEHALNKPMRRVPRSKLRAFGFFHHRQLFARGGDKLSHYRRGCRLPPDQGEVCPELRFGQSSPNESLDAFDPLEVRQHADTDAYRDQAQHVGRIPANFLHDPRPEACVGALPIKFIVEFRPRFARAKHEVLRP